MDEHVYDGMVDDIRKFAMEVEGIIDTEKCHVRKAGLNYYVDLHAIVDGSLTVREGHDLAHKLKAHLQEVIPQLADVLIHIEPEDT